MKKQIILTALFALLCAAGFSQDKGYITITQSATATTAVYDKAVEKLKAAGIWELGWKFHAIGAMQPAGLFSIGIFPDKASADDRAAKTGEVFKANGIPASAPEVFELHDIAPIPFPAQKPANAVLIFHDVKGMTAEQYANIVTELKSMKAFGDPAQLFHACFKTPGGLKVVDIWESPEALQKFAEKLIPILTKIFGAAPPPPSVYGLYNVVNK